MRTAAWLVLGAVFAAAAAAPWIASHTYSEQDRESASAAPSRAHWLGTDDLGRDRWSRLLYGARISLTLAPAAALGALAFAAAIGMLAGIAGGFVEQAILSATDLFASMPWLFLLLIVRAAMPLNAPAWVSVGTTFALMACLGWPGAARIVRAAVRQAKSDGYLLQARAMGVPSLRIWIRHLTPALRPTLAAQFWICVPLFVLTEANLGLLGLGVAEPLPSWGGLLSELAGRRYALESPWLLAPAAGLVATLLAMQKLAAAFEELAQNGERRDQFVTRTGGARRSLCAFDSREKRGSSCS